MKVPRLNSGLVPPFKVCRHLLPLFRSHATVILLSFAMGFSRGDGLDKFIATWIAFHCLAYKQMGIVETLLPNNTQLAKNSNIPDNGVIQTGNKLEFSGPDG